MMTEAGRDLEAVPITLFGGSEDVDLLKRYRDMGGRPGGHHSAAGACRQNAASARSMDGFDPPLQCVSRRTRRPQCAVEALTERTGRRTTSRHGLGEVDERTDILLTHTQVLKVG
jgi:hypothetical protein